MTDETQPIAAWIGREETKHDRLSAETVRGFEATVNDRAVPAAEGDVAPSLAHWLHFRGFGPLSGAEADGHQHRGGFLPPVALPRRMWAGGSLDFLRPLRIGAAIERRSRIEAVTEKTGRQGAMVFVTVRHEIADAEGVAIRERQDIVFREAPRPDQPAPEPEAAPAASTWRRRISPSPLLLFRYSALTMNGHRIHYDRPYTMGVEGYPGLVVHGPLLATFLLGLVEAEMPGRRVSRFSYRAQRPVFDTADFEVCGSEDGATLFIRDAGGALCMKGEAVVTA